MIFIQAVVLHGQWIFDGHTIEVSSFIRNFEWFYDRFCSFPPPFQLPLFGANLLTHSLSLHISTLYHLVPLDRSRAWAQVNCYICIVGEKQILMQALVLRNRQSIHAPEHYWTDPKSNSHANTYGFKVEQQTHIIHQMKFPKMRIEKSIIAMSEGYELIHLTHYDDQVSNWLCFFLRFSHTLYSSYSTGRNIST